ncbi:TfoX/Sxy family protein [Flavobacteriaceae bacterium F89]|uniref:TfoX/Sxy family protein n=1 Tax=Cerina litoralis TaxID=2874477 RepID=A0AAE3ES98_9FLAO|nr:TfoX/Sxy family protein [Cerina litoralis]MCG2459528.1 TfoX/Sxy family protein [Cerina litoralis]
MAYKTDLADKIRAYLKNFPQISVEEKKMFGGLAFMVNGKMCINVSGENLMCRFDPKLTGELSLKKGFKSTVMKGRILNGYCYVGPIGFRSESDFGFWINLCLDFNERAKSSKKIPDNKS